MSVREFRSPDGRPWRVWAVHPHGLVAGVAGERRRGERRTVPVELLEDPPVLQRRRSADRRVQQAAMPRRAAEVLPAPWREGWLVFQSDPAPDTPGAVRETRRLAPIPGCWDGCSDAELAMHLEQADLRDAGVSAAAARRPA